MTERGVGKPWTTDEDKLLIQAVSVHGENDNWKAVAASVPGRTNKACRKRWLHSLSPNVKKSAWTAEEDQLLLQLYATHGTKWSVIARQISGRTDDACSKRYREALDPSLKRDDWTFDEDAKLLQAYARLGGKWGAIGQELNRSGLGCRNRWRMLERRKARPEPTSGIAGPSTPQLATTSGEDSPFYDGRSPQYVAPSVLYQGSPPHAQEPHAIAYSPQQILSGAHLNGSPSSTYETSSLEYTTPSVSHANSVTTPGEPSEFYSRRYAPEHAGSAISDTSVPPPNDSTRSYHHRDYDYMSIDGDPTPNPDNGHEAGPISQTDSALSADLFGDSDPAIPSDPLRPPSPSRTQSGASSPGSSTTPPSDLLTSNPDGTPTHKSYYRTEEEKARDRAQAPRRTELRPARLSSKLPATSDENVLAYACGHRDCWPADAPSSANAFTTSGALSEHSRAVHKGDLGGNKPFRCGLLGCEKSWKSLNGLQYHLQISKYHFQQALTQVPLEEIIVDDLSGPDEERPAPVAPAREEPLPPPAVVPDIYKIKRKTFPCPHSGCKKEYKQLSGLRYHLTHGHDGELPAQLDVIPPTLARIVKEKGAQPRD